MLSLVAKVLKVSKIIIDDKRICEKSFNIRRSLVVFFLSYWNICEKDDREVINSFFWCEGQHVLVNWLVDGSFGWIFFFTVLFRSFFIRFCSLTRRISFSWPKRNHRRRTTKEVVVLVTVVDFGRRSSEYLDWDDLGLRVRYGFCEFLYCQNDSWKGKEVLDRGICRILFEHWGTYWMIREMAENLWNGTNLPNKIPFKWKDYVRIIVQKFERIQLRAENWFLNMDLMAEGHFDFV